MSYVASNQRLLFVPAPKDHCELPSVFQHNNDLDSPVSAVPYRTILMGDLSLGPSRIRTRGHIGIRYLVDRSGGLAGQGSDQTARFSSVHDLGP